MTVLGKIVGAVPLLILMWALGVMVPLIVLSDWLEESKALKRLDAALFKRHP